MEFKGIHAAEGLWAWLFMTVSVYCSPASPQALAELGCYTLWTCLVSLCQVLTYSFWLKSLLSVGKRIVVICLLTFDSAFSVIVAVVF